MPGMYFLRAKTLINIDYPITLNSYMVDVDSTVTETSRAVRVVVVDRGVEKAGREGGGDGRGRWAQPG